ncbi:RNA polymerase sigma-70 factor, ECF subfamily [bacterium A37T11]|nr:RNA polymerase sigma-70 factor, ECF subfamily [bacterium A37T11]
MADYRKYTDSQLIDLLTQGDEQVFTIIYESYFELMYRHAMQILRDSALAGDVVQDVFAYLWEHREAIHIQSSLSAYLYSSTRHAVLKVIRRSQVADRFREHVIQFADQKLPMTDDLTRERELNQIIESEISRLPPRMREVFELKNKQHYTNHEIAALLGITESTVKNQVANALRILKEKLTQMNFFFLEISVLLLFHFFI